MYLRVRFEGFQVLASIEKKTRTIQLIYIKFYSKDQP